jgi:hypothetical protein
MIVLNFGREDVIVRNCRGSAVLAYRRRPVFGHVALGHVAPITNYVATVTEYFIKDCLDVEPI